jgi:hypothetical protein
MSETAERAAAAAADAQDLAAPPQPPPRTTAELRAQVEEARARLATTVGEIGGVIDDTRAQAVRKVKAYAPIAAGAFATYVALRILRRRR